MNARQDYILLAAIAVTLLVLEIGIQLFENRLSGNLNHINEIPEIVDQYTKDDRTKILFLGNSLINESVDIDQLREGLSNQYLVDKITPDATSLWDWNMILKNRVLSSGAKIDYLVIGFAWGLLTDEYNPNPSRLGGYFSEPGDYFLLNRYGMDTFAEFSEFFIGWGSKLFVNREAVKNKVLVNIIPYYETFVRAQNQAGGPTKADDSNTKENSRLHFSILNSLLDRLDEDGTKLIVIAMPIEDNYMVDGRLAELLNARAYRYLDYRDYFRSTGSVYKDGVHLNAKGSALFTANIGQLFSHEK